MARFDISDPDFEPRVRGNFARQSLLGTIGAGLGRVAPGEVEVVLPVRDDLCQQHGFIGAGIVATIADIACGYAAMSLWEADSDGLTVEFKINFLAPANGERLIARGRVIRSGRTISVCIADVFATNRGQETLVATMLATLIRSRVSARPAHGTPRVGDKSFRLGMSQGTDAMPEGAGASAEAVA